MPQFADASWGIEVVSLDTGQDALRARCRQAVRAGLDWQAVYRSTALDTFGPDYRIPTSLFATEKVGRDGELRGDLVLVGYGDPTLGFDKRVSWADVLATAAAQVGHQDRCAAR